MNSIIRYSRHYLKFNLETDRAVDSVMVEAIEITNDGRFSYYFTKGRHLNFCPVLRLRRFFSI